MFEEKKMSFSEQLKNKINENASRMATSSLQRSINESLEFAKSRSGTTTNIDGEKQSLNHMIFEMNEFYMEMAQRLRDLATDLQIKRAEEELEEKFETESVLSDKMVSTLMKRKNSQGYKRQIEKIMDLDKKLEENFQILKVEKEERKSVEVELCGVMEREILDPKAQSFLDSCKIKRKIDGKSGTEIEEIAAPVKLENEKSPFDLNEEEIENVDEVNAALEDENQTQIETLSESTKKSFNKKFIKRNIQLVKNGPAMTGFCLTDEEKLKLEAMLTENETSLDENEDFSNGNPYRVEDGGNELADVEAKLQVYSDIDLTSETSSISYTKYHDRNVYEEIERDEREGKYWKNEQRLKKIEDELRLLEERNDDGLRDQVEVDVEKLIVNAESGEFPADLEYLEDEVYGADDKPETKENIID